MTIRRRIASAAIACLLAAMGMALAATPAHADDYETYQNQHDGLCMSWSYGVGGPAYIARCVYTGDQLWYVQDAGPGVVYLHSTAYNGCLDAHGTGDGIVYMISCNGGAYQRWLVSHVTADIIRFQNEQSHRCLDSHGGDNNDSLWQIGCNSGDYQLWG
jgi:hypothetical protein